jgi:hypothetical protein
MDQQNFKVIFTGELNNGVDIKVAAAAFADKFKQSPEKALKILQTKKEIVLIKNAEHLKAYKFKSVLEEIGLVVRLERVLIKQQQALVIEQQEKVDEEKIETKEKKKEKDAYSWTMQPIESKKEETKPEKESHVYINPAYEKEAVEEEVVKPANNKPGLSTPENESNLFGLAKKIGSWVVGGFALLFIGLKKFGLFKVLKIGGLMTAAAFAGYNPDEVCMGNERCEDTVDDQIDACWDRNNLDDYDWDNMTEETYMIIKPKLEKDFIACFVYEDTHERVFLSPLDIRLDLIDNCEIIGTKSCIQTVEPQIKRCYETNNIENYISEDSFDYYLAVEENQKDFKSYYACFLDETGEKIFQPILDNWSYYYLEEY